ncbi:unnamed protein product, partial [Trichogramma brassicae]
MKVTTTGNCFRGDDTRAFCTEQVESRWRISRQMVRDHHHCASSSSSSSGGGGGGGGGGSDDDDDHDNGDEYRQPRVSAADAKAASGSPNSTPPPPTLINKIKYQPGVPVVKKDKRQSSSRFNVSTHRELQKLPILNSGLERKTLRFESSSRFAACVFTYRIYRISLNNFHRMYYCAQYSPRRGDTIHIMLLTIFV